MLGLQTYTVRDKIQDRESAFSLMRAIKDIGYECVQLAGNAVTLKNCMDACKSAGLKVVGILSSAAFLNESFDFVVELADGARPFDIGISSGIKTEDEAKELVSTANELARRFCKLGFTFSYHNHSNEFINPANNGTLMDILIAGFDQEYVTLMPDTYWLQHGGVDVRAFLEGLSGRVNILHLKDMKRGSDGPTFAPLGEGNMNFPGILSVARAIGATNYIVEQDTCEGDSLECARQSYNYLKSLLDNFK